MNEASATCIQLSGGVEYTCECPTGYATLVQHVSHEHELKHVAGSPFSCSWEERIAPPAPRSRAQPRMMPPSRRCSRLALHQAARAETH